MNRQRLATYVADAAAYLASDLAGFVSGLQLLLNGQLP